MTDGQKKAFPYIVATISLETQDDIEKQCKNSMLTKIQ